MITKGKWIVMKTSDNSWHIYTGSEGNEVDLAAVRNQDFKANARLIAAAPDLLEACKAAKKYLEPDLVEPGRTIFWKLVEAIAKAQGREW